MKCLKSDSFTKLIIFALSLVITVTFCSCSDGEEESSAASEESFVLPEFSQEEVSADDGILSEEEALALINRIKPRVAYLTHMSHEIGMHAETAEKLPEGVFLGYDGLSIEIKE